MVHRRKDTALIQRLCLLLWRHAADVDLQFVKDDEGGDVDGDGGCGGSGGGGGVCDSLLALQHKTSCHCAGAP